MNEFKSKIVSDLKTLMKDKKLVLDILKEVDDDDPVGNCKSSQLSDKLRDKGGKILANDKLDKKQLHKVLSLYNESISRAPVGSEEMAKTYANRSGILLDMRKYKESISEADKALKITNLIFLKVKLWCRKAECFTALGSSENRSCLEKARFILNKSVDPPKIKELLEKFIKDVEAVVNQEKLDKPKGTKRMVDVSKMIAEVEKMDMWKNVELKYSKKYGNHIVAARDFEPGEIILVEKPYTLHLNESRMYQYCCKCFQYLWTVVPCEHCCWCVYCSEVCRDEAWQEYHDLECSVMSKIKFALCCQWTHAVPILLRMFFKAFKEAGSIDQLLSDFKSSLSEGYCNKDMNYKTILATKSLPVKRENLNFHTGSPVLALLGLAKFTTIFERSFSFNEIQKLMKNETAILTGCLLVKLSSVLFTGCGSINLVDPAVEDGSYGETKPAYEMNAQEWVIRKCYMSHITTMLALYGCIPNADSCRTIGHKSLLYALQPIKAGTPIMTYNKSLSIYLEVPKEVRQHQLRLFYGFSCECRACKENWPEKMLEMPPLFAFTPGTNFAALTRFMKESESIRKECNDNMYAHKPGFPDLKLMTRANNCAREAWKHMPVPSLFMKSCADMIICVTTCFHDPDKNIFTISE